MQLRQRPGFGLRLGFGFVLWEHSDARWEYSVLGYESIVTLSSSLDIQTRSPTLFAIILTPYYIVRKSICVVFVSTGINVRTVNCKSSIEGTYHFTYEVDYGGGGICDSANSVIVACQLPGSIYVDNQVFEMNFGTCDEVSTSLTASKLTNCSFHCYTLTNKLENQHMSSDQREANILSLYRLSVILQLLFRGSFVAINACILILVMKLFTKFTTNQVLIALID